MTTCEEFDLELAAQNIRPILLQLAGSGNYHKAEANIVACLGTLGVPTAQVNCEFDLGRSRVIINYGDRHPLTMDLPQSPRTVESEDRQDMDGIDAELRQERPDEPVPA